ncbi:MAG: hypothetical protein AAFO69_00145 [Bacteroidota bacterium]
MSLSDQDQELFEAYENRQLSPEEVKIFEDRLDQDRELYDHFLAYREAVKSLKLSGFADVVEEVMLEQEQIKNKGSVSWPKIAAAVLLTIVGTVTILSLVQDDEVNFTALYRPYPNVLQERAASDNTLETALQFYQKGDYGQSIELLGSISPASDTVRFYLGLSYLSTEIFDDAIENLSAIDAVNSIFAQQINWYLGIGYLGNQQPGEAVKSLQRIQPREYNYKKAQEVIRALK